MPDWQPNWQDVAFDHARAAAAADACDRAAASLVLTVDRLATVRTAATRTADWTGRYAEDFDTEAAAAGGDAGTTRTALADLARQIRAAGVAATAEQGAREASRARWRVEAAAEAAAGERCRPGRPC